MQIFALWVILKMTIIIAGMENQEADQEVSLSTSTKLTSSEETSDVPKETTPTTSSEIDNLIIGLRTHTKVEDECLDYFKGRTLEDETGLTHWNTVWLSYHLQKTAAAKICEEAHTILKRGPFVTKNVVSVISSYSYNNPYMIMWSKKTKEIKRFSITVLECKTNWKHKFYITNGRRANSIYFVRPSVAYNEYGLPDNFVLDPNFENDIDLPFNFLKFSLERKNIRNPNITSLDRARLEKQYANYFYEHFLKHRFNSAEWTALAILVHEDKTTVERICVEAYAAQQPLGTEYYILPTVHSFNYEYTKIKFISVLSREKPSFAISVLECIVNGQTFYITRGRRPSCVYFVKPSEPPKKYEFPISFVLDANFQGDIDLHFDFSQVALERIQKPRNSIDEGDYPRLYDPWA